jgi:hypothetical protein
VSKVTTSVGDAKSAGQHLLSERKLGSLNASRYHSPLTTPSHHSLTTAPSLIREREYPNQLGALRLGTLCDVRLSNAKDLHNMHALDLITMDNVLTVCCRGREQKLQWAKLLLGICAAGGPARAWREDGGLEAVMGPGGSGEKGRVAQAGGTLVGVAGNVAEAGACGFVALLFKVQFACKISAHTPSSITRSRHISSRLLFHPRPNVASRSF